METLLDRVRMHAAQQGSNVAVTGTDGRVTYAELSATIRRIRDLLLGSGIGKASLVAIYHRRGWRTVAALLAVMDAGAAYTIVENDGNLVENGQRLRLLSADVVLTSHEDLATVAELGLPALAWDNRTAAAAEAPSVTFDDIAYVVFTSGSTGVPKGVAITHGNISHYTGSIRHRLRLPDGLRFAHVSTFAADLGNTCLFLSLWTGGTLHVMDLDTRRDPARFAAFLAENRIDFLKITPSHLAAVLGVVESLPNRPHLRYLVPGGEALSRKLVQRVFRMTLTDVLVNHYGPSETTVGVMVNVLDRATAVAGSAGDSVPIGKPFGRTRILVRSRGGTFRATSATGELFIGGPAVGRGYVKDGDATAQKFVAVPSHEGRFYRTGDIVRVDSAGTVTFVGRSDRQVKVNGYRVELEHIEAVLRQVPGTGNAAVFHLMVNGRAVLAAAILDGGGHLDVLQLRADLQDRMPAYMVPGELLPFSEFPMNANGKIDYRTLQELVERRLQSGSARQPATEAAPSTGGASTDAVVESWARCLGHRRFGRDDSFFDVGGNSIDAIQVIADLQARGYPVSAARFLQSPTVRALSAAVDDSTAARSLPVEEKRSSQLLSPAQAWFFEQNFSHPDHWNQTVLLRTEADVSVAAMATAVHRLLEAHPLLRTAFAAGGRERARTIDLQQPLQPFTTSRIATADRAALPEIVEQTSQRLQGSLAVAEGRVFLAHLFKFDAGPDQLLLVAHHLSVDVVSWRILIEDLDRLYSATVQQADLALPPDGGRFWHWVAELHDRTPDLREDLRFWRSLPTPSRPVPSTAGANLERDAEAIWLACTGTETDSLVDLSRRLGVPEHVIVLGCVVHSLFEHGSRHTLSVDVESHGRIDLAGRTDVSRVVGWFTSMFPITVERTGIQAVDLIKRLDAILKAVPHLGTAYGLMPEERPQTAAAAELCYNHLGEVAFGSSGLLGLRPSRFRPGPARGGSNSRVHDLKLTARTVNGQLVLDLSYSSARHARQTMTDVMAGAKETLLGLIDGAKEPVSTVWERGSTTGVVSYVPSGLRLDGKAADVRVYQRILLTGATGYIGLHLLHELLERHGASIDCLVRAADDRLAYRRLASAYRRSFGKDLSTDHAGRCTAIAGDLSEVRLGLSDARYSALCRHVDAIFHCAADTRLFGSYESFERQNLRPVEAVIALASSGRQKDLHHMSTLAVCGINRQPEPVVFSEQALDIGQTFQNEYERTKYQAELLVRQYAAAGGRVYIYRMGDVTGHSRTGRFQDNASDNRFVQLLKAVCKLGKVPRRIDDVIRLSPVDMVAQGIVAIATSANVAGGVFHVDTDKPMPLRDVFDCARELGIHLEPTPHDGLLSLFRDSDTAVDPDLALGYFWAAREPRNVHYDHNATLALLRSLGCEFREMNRRWLRLFLGHLIEDQGLAIAGRGPAPAPHRCASAVVAAATPAAPAR